jgi:hypothetical protein
MNGLFGSAILDTAIGLVFVYLLLAIFCTTVNEGLSSVFSLRAKYLKRSLEQLLQDPQGAADLLKKFYAHPVIASMMNGQRHPSYIPARSFARVIMDLVTPNILGPLDFNALESGMKSLPPGRIKTALLSLIQDADKNLDRAQGNIEAWYDDAMDRVSGWYKRHIQIVTIFVALVITVATNADTVNITWRLWTDPGMRTALVEQWKERVKTPRPTATVKYEDPNNPLKPTVTTSEGNQITDQDRKLLGNILGWSNQLENVSWLERILGWILTVIAVSLGAPFWFDALNKFMNIRNSGKSPNEQPKVPEKPKLPPTDRAA